MDRRIAWLLLPVLLLLTAAGPVAAGPAPATARVSAARTDIPLTSPIHGNAAATRTAPVADAVGLQRSMFGINVAVWDYSLPDPSTAPLIRRLGVGMEQFPNAEDWSWVLDRGRYPSPTFTHWDPYLAGASLNQWGDLLRATDTKGLYIVNYGANPSWTGGETVADVERLTHYIVETHIPVRAMVIGSEQYGDWVVNLHHDKSAARYADLARQMAEAIHAIAPAIKVGVVLAPPDPLGPGPYDLSWNAKNLQWNQTVLRVDAPVIQFVSVHDYPLWHLESDPAMLASLSVMIPKVATLLRDQIDRDAGPDARHIATWITEFSPYNLAPPPQSIQPVFGAALTEGMLLWAASGIGQVDWWDLHSGISRATDGGYGTTGLAGNGTAPELALDTLYPSGQAYGRLMQAVGNGAKLQIRAMPATDHGLFVAELAAKGGKQWVVINATDESQTTRIGGTQVQVGPAAMKWIASGGS